MQFAAFNTLVFNPRYLFQKASDGIHNNLLYIIENNESSNKITLIFRYHDL